MSSTSSVIAIAITASLNASTRADSLISVVVLANPLTVSGTDRYNSVMTLTENPFLSGNYGPVAEEVTTFDLPTDGALPTELDGRYLRIGPNPYSPPEGAYHWFLGDGMVHGVEIRDGNASWYRNRWVRTTTITEARGEPPVEGPKPPMYDASNTHVIGHAGRILSLTEGAMPYELSNEL